jgi:hypothetical protein
MALLKRESPYLTSSSTETESSNTPKPTIKSPDTETSVLPRSLASSIVVVINEIMVYVKLKHEYDEVHAFYEELSKPNKDMVLGNETVSILQLHTLITLSNTVDMSNQNLRTVYRPTLSIHKNDEFSPFKYYFLLTLLDIEYAVGGPSGGEFPALWKTTLDTKVTVRLVEWKSPDDGRTIETLNASSNDSAATLLDVFRIICREQKYDESHATLWEDSFKGMQHSLFTSSIIVLSLFLIKLNISVHWVIWVASQRAVGINYLEFLKS